MSHALTLAKVACPSCGEPAPMTSEGFRTCVGWCGEHDRNCVEGIFTCPRGHHFAATTQYECSCGWSGVKRCTISGHDQVRLLG